MFDEQEFSRKLRELIRLLYAMPENSVRPAPNNAPTGKEPYATVQIIFSDSQGTAEERLANATGNDVTSTKSSHTNVVCSVQFFRDNAKSRAMSLETVMQSQFAIDFLRKNGIGFVGTSVFRDLSALVDTQWEQRAQVDLELSCIISDARTLPTYGTFPLETTVDVLTVNSEVNDQ